MLDTTDLLEPLGDLTPGMFPDDDAAALTARLDGYLTRATTIATPAVAAEDLDDAVRAYAYYLAFRAAANLLASKPASAALQGLGSVSYSASQFQYFSERASGALLAYEALLIDVSANVIPRTAPTTTRFTW